MRVLYFTRDYTAHDHRFLAGLAQTEHEVYSLRLEKRGTQREDRPLPAGITQVLWVGGQAPVKRSAYRKFSRHLKSVIAYVQPDVIHAGTVQTAALVAAMSGFQPLVTMSWGYDMLMDSDRSSRMKKDTAFTITHSSVFVCDCQAVASKAVEYGFAKDRIVQFPWGVDLTHFNPAGRGDDRKRLHWAEEDFIILSLRAWEPIYDVMTVVRGFIDAVQSQPQLRLVLLGGGSQAGLLRQMLTNAGVMEKVHFGGRVGYDELPRYYRAADLYASASLTDGSSVSLMESLACGTPAVVSAIPGNLDWVDENTGWFFPVGDWQKLSDLFISASQEQGANLMKMREHARRTAEARADWEKNFQKLMGAYSMALEK